MQRLLDKYGLWAALIVVGSIILWGLFLSPGRPEEASKTRPGIQAPALK